MAKVIVHTDEAPKSLAGYSQAVKSGGFVFVAGQGPFDARTGEVIGTTIQEQTAQCLKNIAAILQAANSSLERAVSATFILGEESDFAGMSDGSNSAYSARTAQTSTPTMRLSCSNVLRASICCTSGRLLSGPASCSTFSPFNNRC